jgi:hypothetical protein
VLADGGVAAVLPVGGTGALLLAGGMAAVLLGGGVAAVVAAGGVAAVDDGAVFGVGAAVFASSLWPLQALNASTAASDRAQIKG